MLRSPMLLLPRHSSPPSSPSPRQTALAMAHLDEAWLTQQALRRFDCLLEGTSTREVYQLREFTTLSLCTLAGIYGAWSSEGFSARLKKMDHGAGGGFVPTASWGN